MSVNYKFVVNVIAPDVKTKVFLFLVIDPGDGYNFSGTLLFDVINHIVFHYYTNVYSYNSFTQLWVGQVMSEHTYVLKYLSTEDDENDVQ